jgi:NADPH:quinone reductase-like Zn-dependent oxidoreductase
LPAIPKYRSQGMSQIKVISRIIGEEVWKLGNKDIRDVISLGKLIRKGEWLLQSAARSELGRMIIRMAKHDGIRTMNVVRRHEVVAELKQLGDAVIVPPRDRLTRKIDLVPQKHWMMFP